MRGASCGRTCLGSARCACRCHRAKGLQQQTPGSLRRHAQHHRMVLPDRREGRGKHPKVGVGHHHRLGPFTAPHSGRIHIVRHQHPGQRPVRSSLLIRCGRIELPRRFGVRRSHRCAIKDKCPATDGRLRECVVTALFHGLRRQLLPRFVVSARVVSHCRRVWLASPAIPTRPIPGNPRPAAVG